MVEPKLDTALSAYLEAHANDAQVLLHLTILSTGVVVPMLLTSISDLAIWIEL